MINACSFATARDDFLRELLARPKLVAVAISPYPVDSVLCVLPAFSRFAIAYYLITVEFVDLQQFIDAS